MNNLRQAAWHYWQAVKCLGVVGNAYICAGCLYSLSYMVRYALVWIPAVLFATWLALLQGCGSTGAAEWTTRQGWKVYVHDVPVDQAVLMEQLDKQIDLFVATALADDELYSGFTAEDLDKWEQRHVRITLQGDPTDCDGAIGTKKGDKCYGLQYGPDIFVQVSFDCLAHSALAHELTHSLAYYTRSGPDGDHNNPKLFGPNSLSNNGSWYGCAFGCSDFPVCREAE